MSAEEIKKETKKKKKMRRLSMEVAKDGSGLKIPYPIQRWDETLEVLRMRGFEAFETSLLPVPPVVMQNRFSET